MRIALNWQCMHLQQHKSKERTNPVLDTREGTTASRCAAALQGTPIQSNTLCPSTHPAGPGPAPGMRAAPRAAGRAPRCRPPGWPAATAQSRGSRARRARCRRLSAPQTMRQPLQRILQVLHFCPMPLQRRAHCSAALCEHARPSLALCHDLQASAAASPQRSSCRAAACTSARLPPTLPTLQHMHAPSNRCQKVPRTNDVPACLGGLRQRARHARAGVHIHALQRARACLRHHLSTE